MRKSEAPAPQIEPDASEVRVEVEGKAWTVTVMGRAGGGGAGAAPLLLLGFRPEGAEGTPTHEALTVGRTLQGLSEASLTRALASATPAVAADDAGPPAPNRGSS